jgi:hypothetical protein
MSSGKINMLFTYTSKNINNNLATTTAAPRQEQPRLIPSNLSRMNRFTNTSASMHTIIHTPAKGCSSCGS